MLLDAAEVSELAADHAGGVLQVEEGVPEVVLQVGDTERFGLDRLQGADAVELILEGGCEALNLPNPPNLPELPPISRTSKTGIDRE